MTSRPIFALLLLFAVTFAGCASNETALADDESPDVAQSPGQDGPSGGDTAPVDGNASVPDGNATVQNAAPAISLNATVLAGVVPFDVLVEFNATDLDGDVLNWTLSFDGEVMATGEALPGNHTISVTSGGNHSLVFFVTDGIANATQNLTIVATQIIPIVADIADAEGDTELDAVDLTRLQAEVRNGKLVVVVTVVDLPTGADAPALIPWKYRLYVGAHQFQNFNYAGPDIWDTTNGGYIGGASWDTTKDTVSFAIDISRLDGLGLVAPYSIAVETGTGALSAMPHQKLDIAPDTGRVLVG